MTVFAKFELLVLCINFSAKNRHLRQAQTLYVQL
jgi:hypothetical protein